MQRSLERLSDELAALSADIQAATCRWLMLLAEFDRREGWAIEGSRTCAQWVGWRCGVGEEAAREYVRVARRLEELPLVREAFGSGSLSYSKVRALTRVRSVEREAELVELAHTTTASQLEKVVRAYRGVVRADEDVKERFEARFLDWWVEDNGEIRLRGRLPAEQGAVLVKAIEAVRDRMLCGVSAEPPEVGTSGEARAPVGARNADALTQLAETALASEAASTGGDRFQVVVHVDAEALRADRPVTEGARCCVEPEIPISGATLRRVTCDAALVEVVERDGVPLSVGRKTRSISPALRRALRSRDGCCQFPGCGNSRHTDAHHLHHWADGGTTELGNLVTLCRHHHRLLHEGGFAVAGAPGALEFTSPAGRRLRPGPSARPPGRGTVPSVSAETRLQPFEPLNLDYAVDAVIAFAPIRRPPDPGEQDRLAA